MQVKYLPGKVDESIVHKVKVPRLDTFADILLAFWHYVLLIISIILYLLYSYHISLGKPDYPNLLVEEHDIQGYSYLPKDACSVRK